VSVLPKLLFPLVGRDFSQFAFSSAGHFKISSSQDYPRFRPEQKPAGFASMKHPAKKVKGPKKVSQGGAIYFSSKK
jgi:hypothetical protein